MPDRSFDYGGFSRDLRDHSDIPKELQTRFMHTLLEYDRTHGKLTIWNAGNFQKICGECNCSKYKGDPKQALEAAKKYHEKLINEIEKSGANKEVIDRYKKELNKCYESKCEFPSFDSL